MNNINNLEETIDLYVKGKLKGQDLDAFKQLLNSDSSMAAEVQMQQAIVEAVKQSRINALKTRLQNIDVSALPTEPTIGQTVSAWVGSKAAVVAVASIGFTVGAYYYFQNNRNNNELAAKPERVQVVEAIVNENDEDDAATLVEATDLTADAATVTEEKQNENASNVTALAAKRPEAVEIKKTATNKSKIAAPKGNILEQMDDNRALGEGITKDAESPKEKISEQAKTSAADIDIKPVAESKYKFHYMLKDNTLYLYGNFDASPYEIFELNESAGQSFYLYYDNSYFELKNGKAEVSKLKKLTDAGKIANLEVLRAKRH